MRKLLAWAAIALALLGAAPALATITSPTVTVTDTATGASNVFNYGFLIPFQADGVTPAVTVQTVVGGVVTTLTPSQYTIVGVGNATGGTVTINGTPLASGSSVIITRSYAYTQNTSVLNIGFYPHTVEQVADSLEYQIQQLNQISTNLLGTANTWTANQNFTQGITSASYNGYTPANAATFVAASDFGVGTGVTDNGPLFNTAFAAGKVVVLQPGVYNIATTLAITNSYTGIRCAASAGFLVSTTGAVLGNPDGGCTLKWTGASGGTMFTITAPAGASNGRLHANVVEGINFDGNNGLAANGLAIFSELLGNFRNLSFWNLSGGTALRLDIQAGTLGEPPESQWNEFDNIAQGPFGNEIGLVLNFAAFNRFANLMFQANGPDNIDIIGSDNNHFYDAVAYQNAAAGKSVRFKAATTPVYFPSQENTFWGLSGSVISSVYADGQTTLPGCAAWFVNLNGGNGCTGNNNIFQLDKGNSVPDPVVEPGASVFWTNNDGTSAGTHMSGQIVLGDTYANQMAAAGGANPLESLHIRNQSQDHIVLDNSGGASKWTIDLDSNSGVNANLNVLPGVSGFLRTNSIWLNNGAFLPGAGTNIDFDRNQNNNPAFMFQGADNSLFLARGWVQNTAGNNIAESTSGGLLDLSGTQSLSFSIFSGGTVGQPLPALTTIFAFNQIGSQIFTPLSVTGLITPASNIGIAGTTAADNVQAGSIGEYLTASASSVAIASATNTNVASISLPAGDWDIAGELNISLGTGTTTTNVACGINTTSATLPSASTGVLYIGQWQGSLLSTAGGQNVSCPITRVNVASTTTVFLVGFTQYSGGTNTANGFIRARRVR